MCVYVRLVGVHYCGVGLMICCMDGGEEVVCLVFVKSEACKESKESEPCKEHACGESEPIREVYAEVTRCVVFRGCLQEGSRWQLALISRR